MFSTSSVQPRWVMGISFNGLTRRNFSRTSSGGTMMVAADVRSLSFDFSVGDSSPRLPPVLIISIRASAGTRFRAMLHPTQPARRAVDESGLRLMMAEGGKAKCRKF